MQENAKRVSTPLPSGNRGCSGQVLADLSWAQCNGALFYRAAKEKEEIPMR